MKDTFLYYCFDFDDNILNMSTQIIVSDINDVEVGIETQEFRKYRNIIGKRKFEYKCHIIVVCPKNEKGQVDCNLMYKNFTDYPNPNVFIQDVIKTLHKKSYGPAWKDFIECITNGSIFCIITARGHEDIKIRKAIEYIINNELNIKQKRIMYKNLLNFSYFFKGIKNEEKLSKDILFTENKIVKNYLNTCEFIGVTSVARGGSYNNIEKLKADAIIKFKNRINKFGEKYGKKIKIGFSDDDLKNVKHIEDLFNNVNHEEFSHIIQYTVKNSNDPHNITKTVRNIK